MKENIEAKLNIEQSGALAEENISEQSEEQMLIKRFQDLFNSCESEFNREQSEFWQRAQAKLREWSEADRNFLLYYAGPDLGKDVMAALAGRKPIPLKRDINRLKS